jgi:D-alanyl-D-alanine carboxypeptidase (penicillin-binding protein 5/6)
MMMKKNRSQLYTSLSLLLIPIVVIFGLYFYSETSQKQITTTTPLETKEQASNSRAIKTISNPFDDINLTAKSAIVVDINSGDVLYSKNPDIPLPLASINKVMTALVAYLESDPNQRVVIDHWALMKDGEDFFVPGENFNLKELVDFMLVKSSNDGAAAIASAINVSNGDTLFVQKMNQTANEIGMKNTFFLNETGLDQDPTTAGSFGTSRDIATLFEFVLKNYPDILKPTKELNVTAVSNIGIAHNATNTNIAIPEIDNLIASKTGFTDLAGGNLAVIVDPALNRPVAIVVLGSTFDGRFDDVIKLSDSLVEYFEYKDNN